MAHQAIDRLIGARVRVIRQSQKLSLRYVAERLGVSHQQLLKYERGKSRISSERLAALADILNTSVAVLVGEGSQPEDVTKLLLDDAEMRLLNGFAKIKHPGSRMYLIKMVENWPVTSK